MPTTAINSITLEVDDVAAAQRFYDEAFGLSDLVRIRAGASSSHGFRGFVMSLVVAEPAVVDAYFDAAVRADATVVKPAKKSLWGYGGVVAAPDGTLWKLASSSKKDSGSPTIKIDDVVLLLGVDDIVATKQFYVDHGMTVGKSFGRKYVDFESPSGTVKLALYGRKAAAKDAGVPAEGGGSHRLVVNGTADSFTDPDGFEWH